MKHLLYAAVAASLAFPGLAMAQAAGGNPGGAATRAQPTTPPAAGLPGAPTGGMPMQPSDAPSGFKTEADAKAACGTDTVVWGNTRSKVIHMAGSKAYGKTARGTYMCQMVATKAGYHPAKPGQ